MPPAAAGGPAKGVPAIVTAKGGGKVVATDGGAVKEKAPRGKKKDVDDLAAEADAAGSGAQEPKVDYTKLYDVPECPVFHPTAKEFIHPGKYIESISEQVRE